MRLYVAGRFHLVIDEDHRPRHGGGACRLCAALFGGRFGLAAGQALRGWRPVAVALLRGDRQDRRCADPVEDRHQRTAAGLSVSAVRRYASRPG